MARLWRIPFAVYLTATETSVAFLFHHKRALRIPWDSQICPFGVNPMSEDTLELRHCYETLNNFYKDKVNTNGSLWVRCFCRFII